MAAAPSYISTLSLHDALPIWLLAVLTEGQRAKWKDLTGEPAGFRKTLLGAPRNPFGGPGGGIGGGGGGIGGPGGGIDRKSTRLNSSHLGISYAVFCLKKKNI